MKKLTAGVFATILGLTAVDAFAAVPSKGYVDSALKTKQDVLTKVNEGTNVTITTDENGVVKISSSYTDTDTKYTAGKFVDIDEDNVITTTYTAGTNVQISDTGVISATDNDTKYTAGAGLNLENGQFTADVVSVQGVGSNVSVVDEDGTFKISVTDSDSALNATDDTTTGKYTLTKIVDGEGKVSFGWELIDREFVAKDLANNGQ